MTISILKMDKCSSETSVVTRPTQRYIPEEGIRHVCNLSTFQAEYRLLTGRQLRFGVRRWAVVIVPVSAALITAFTWMAYDYGFILRWWQALAFIFMFAISIILPFIWLFTCAVIVRVAACLAEDMEQVRKSRILRDSRLSRL
jgi:hypothetical protein